MEPRAPNKRVKEIKSVEMKLKITPKVRASVGSKWKRTTAPSPRKRSRSCKGDGGRSAAYRLPASDDPGALVVLRGFG